MSEARGHRRSNLGQAIGRSSFGADAAGYDTSRSGYPASLFERLRSLASAEPRILEIGAGTGLATQGLLRLAPSRIVLIESDPRLCEFLDQKLPHSELEVVCSAFPSKAVTGRFELVTCAAAFHWLDSKEALASIQELLAADGTLAIWWNCYFGNGEDGVFGHRVSRILEENGVALPPSYVGGQHYALDVEGHTQRLVEGGFGIVQHHLYRRERNLDAAEAVKLFRTFSFISALDEERRDRVLQQTSDVIDDELQGCAAMPVVTSLYTATRGVGGR